MRGAAGTRFFIGLTGAAVVVSVVAGVVVLPPPGQERARRLDERRVEDLRAVTRAADLYWTRHGELPASMQDLSRESGVSVSGRDPGTGQDYELRALDAVTYQLCANFDGNSADSRGLAGPNPDVSEEFWTHGTGRRCFTLHVQEMPSRQRRQR